MRCLLILDRYGYKSNNDKYKELLTSKYPDNEIIYTRYEDETIRKVRNWPFIGNMLLHLLRWEKSFRYALDINKRKDIDIVISLNPIVGILLAILPHPHRPKFEKLIVCGFLFENKKNKLYYILRKIFTKHALKKISCVVVYGNAEVNYYENIFNLKGKFKFVPYGIDYLDQTKYSLEKLPESYIFSGGGSNRDYNTLIKAYNQIKNVQYPLVIATQPWRVADYDTSKCIILTNVVNETFGDVLKGSLLLILSLKDTQISAGHMVMLQAMSLGIPILVNDIPAIRDYVDETMVTFYESANDKQLACFMQKCINSHDIIQKAQKAKEIYYLKYTSFALIKRLISL